MKNGFTLIELLAILVLLSVIILVAVPSLIESNRTQKINETENFSSTINLACETYASVNPGAVGTTVSVDNLINSGYLKGNLLNPRTNKKISEEHKNVTISKDSDKRITCTYPN